MKKRRIIDAETLLSELEKRHRGEGLVEDVGLAIAIDLVKSMMFEVSDDREIVGIRTTSSGAKEPIYKETDELAEILKRLPLNYEHTSFVNNWHGKRTRIYRFKFNSEFVDNPDVIVSALEFEKMMTR